MKGPLVMITISSSWPMKNDLHSTWAGNETHKKVIITWSLLLQGEEESGEDSDEDDGFFVPHGYLSEDEGENSDREAGEEVTVSWVPSSPGLPRPDFILQPWRLSPAMESLVL